MVQAQSVLSNVLAQDPEPMTLEQQVGPDGESISETPAGDNISASNNVTAASENGDDVNVRLILRSSNIDPSLSFGLCEIAQNCPRNDIIYIDDFNNEEHIHPDGEHDWVISFSHDPELPPGELQIKSSHNNFLDIPNDESFQIEIRYHRTCEAFRGLGHILAVTRRLRVWNPPNSDDQSNPENPIYNATFGEWSGDVGQGLNVTQTCQFENTGVMLDCSRNGVLNVQSAQELLRYFALLGINMCMLYTEDTYEIPGEPFFGYFRGPYTFEELKSIDDYAYELGIEMIPCIQTLGHLSQVLQWPVYAELRDTTDVVLVEHPSTLILIEKMIKSVSAPFRSKRIHIGMDESYGLGEGRQAAIYGHKDPKRLFIEHLNRVNNICKNYGLRPIIWSDMVFCLSAGDNTLGGYYDSGNPTSDELIKGMPEDVDLVFWSYYHSVSERYSQKIREHWQFAKRAPWMASGVWTWSRFWAALPFTYETVGASMAASKEPNSGIRTVMTTLWGDEGNECDIFSGMPGIVFYAEHAYTSKPIIDMDLAKAKFDGICGGSFDDFSYASKLDDTAAHHQPHDSVSRLTPNLSKFLLWEEPAYGMLSPQYNTNFDLQRHFDNLATYLLYATHDEYAQTHSSRPPQKISDLPFNRHLKLPLLLAQILSLKTHLRDLLAYEYKNGQNDRLEMLAGSSSESRLSCLRTLLDEMRNYHRDLWMKTYKPFGWEVLDLRYGGLKNRLETLQWRICSYLDPKNKSVNSIPELEVQNRPIWPNHGPYLMLDFHRVSRPQCY